MALQIQPFDGPIGMAVTSVDLSQPMDAGDFKILLDAWNEHSVLVFRDQSLEPEHLIDFSRRFGDLMISLRPPASDWENGWKANNEAHPLVNNWKFLGVGIAVTSVSQAVDYYESLGFVSADDVCNDEQFSMRRQCV